MKSNEATSLKALNLSKRIAWRVYVFIGNMDQIIIADSSDFDRSMKFYYKNIDRITKYANWVECINKKYGFNEESFSNDLRTLLPYNHLI